MGLYKYLSKAIRSHSTEMIQIQRERMIEWRRENNVKKIEYPTNLVSARRLGYKAKTGFILIRVRVPRGGKARPSIRHGRRSAHSGQRLVFAKGYQRVAEERANKQYPNLEVLNSYKAGMDGVHYWFEVIMLDPYKPNVANSPTVGWISNGKHNGRVYRGLTSAGKRNRGLGNKGQGAEKLRHSLRAHDKTGK